MTVRGFYRRRRGVLEHLQSGRITLFDAAVHDFLCLNAQSQVGNGSAIPPGVWTGSATKIYLLTGRNESQRIIRRSLEKLARIGWIKTWHEQGRKGDYPILISRLVVRDASGNDFIVNSEETTDWRHPVLLPYEPPRRDVTVKRPRCDREASGLLQEEKNEGGKKETLGPESLFEIWNSERGILPQVRTLTPGRNRKCLARLKADPGFLETFCAAVRKARETPFCRGENDTGWKVTFDWLLRNEDHCQRVLEGNYDRKGDVHGQPRKQSNGDGRSPDLSRFAGVGRKAGQPVG